MQQRESLPLVRACALCAEQLEPRPVLRLDPVSRVLVIGQAPGARVHASGVPWDDRSGEHLIEWLDVDRETFDDPRSFGILPMAFCFPGRGKSGDLPPPARCAETWHRRLLDTLPHRRLTLLVGQYAQKWYLGDRRRPTLTETVRAFGDYGPDFFPLPHPSWRSRIWMKRNPWFTSEVLPALRARVAEALDDANAR
ncbi:MAG: uracil-DNA glycosylase family protein [Myxococcota bacterium]